MVSTNSSHRTASPRSEEAGRGRKDPGGKANAPTYTPEYPVPAVEPHLAEVWLLSELGENAVEEVGPHRFEFLRRELIGGTLYWSAVLSASRGNRREVAA